MGMDVEGELPIHDTDLSRICVVGEHLPHSPEIEIAAGGALIIGKNFNLYGCGGVAFYADFAFRRRGGLWQSG
jgi:hypothetical protein